MLSVMNATEIHLQLLCVHLGIAHTCRCQSSLKTLEAMYVMLHPPYSPEFLPILTAACVIHPLEMMLTEAGNFPTLEENVKELRRSPCN